MNPVASRRVAIIGGGPAGLMAAEVLSAAGVSVELFDAMPSVGRKFLLAGKGGLNLTHSEPLPAFVARYGDRSEVVGDWLAGFDPAALITWAHGLGIPTFIGSSGRVFPEGMKAAPLLRAWLHRLKAGGVRLSMRHQWRGWDDRGALAFGTPVGARHLCADATVLALGGASWPRLGSDGAWVPHLMARGVSVAPLRPANCGFDVGWSAHFADRFAGHPLKSISMSWCDADGSGRQRRGECVVTATGVEGSLIYAAAATLRDTIEAHGSALIRIDLAPDRSESALSASLERPRGARSLANHLRVRAGIDGVKAGLLRECLDPSVFADPALLAAAIKALPVRLLAARPIDEAISSAGGVRFDALDARLMLSAMPGVFCAGEMLDWEAPTGGYLLSACLASGRAAAQGVLQWFASEGIAGGAPAVALV